MHAVRLKIEISSFDHPGIVLMEKETRLPFPPAEGMFLKGLSGFCEVVDEVVYDVADETFEVLLLPEEGHDTCWKDLLPKYSGWTARDGDLEIDDDEEVTFGDLDEDEDDEDDDEEEDEEEADV